MTFPLPPLAAKTMDKTGVFAIRGNSPPVDSTCWKLNVFQTLGGKEEKQETLRPLRSNHTQTQAYVS